MLILNVQVATWTPCNVSGKTESQLSNIFYLFPQLQSIKN